MMYKLTIGYQGYLLPSDKGLSTLIATLSRAVKIEVDRRYSDKGITLGEPLELTVEPLPGYRMVKRPARPPVVEVLDPEVLPHRSPRQLSAGRRQLRHGQPLLQIGGAA